MKRTLGGISHIHDAVIRVDPANPTDAATQHCETIAPAARYPENQ
jgi:hypothetical protein